MEKGYGRQGAGDRSVERNPYTCMRFNGYWNLDGNSDINLQGEKLECVNCIRNLFPCELYVVG